MLFCDILDITTLATNLVPHSKGKYAHNSRVICDILDITTLATNLVPHSKEKYDEIDYYFV